MRLYASILLLGMAFPAWSSSFTINKGGGNSFSPSTLSITTGDSVTWSCGLSAGHSLVLDDGAGTCATATGFPYTQVFNTPGTFRYHCPVAGHSTCGISVCTGCLGMVGTITVSNPTFTSTPTPTFSISPTLT